MRWSSHRCAGCTSSSASRTDARPSLVARPSTRSHRWHAAAGSTGEATQRQAMARRIRKSRIAFVLSLLLRAIRRIGPLRCIHVHDRLQAVLSSPGRVGRAGRAGGAGAARPGRVPPVRALLSRRPPEGRHGALPFAGARGCARVRAASQGGTMPSWRARLGNGQPHGPATSPSSRPGIPPARPGAYP